MIRYRSRLLIFAAALCLTLSGCGSSAPKQSPPPVELRGVRLSTLNSHVYESRENISAAMQFLSEHNFNVVFPAVFHNGATLYHSNVLMETIGIDTAAAYNGRDQLAEIVEEAHKRNIAVIPWFESGLALPKGNLLLQKKPRWAVRDRSGNILVKNSEEWLNALHPDVQQFILSIVGELVKNYNIDGIQGSDKMPAMPIEGGYDSVTQAMFFDVHDGTPPPLDFRETHWKYWRAVKLNNFAQRIYWSAKSIKPNMIVSWGVEPFPASLDQSLQDWRSWITLGVNGENFGDWAHPEIRAETIVQYKLILDSQNKESIKINNPDRFLYPVVYLENISMEYLKEALRYNRYCGYNGEVISSYEDLRKNDGNLANTLFESYYKTPARLPFTAAFQK